MKVLVTGGAGFIGANLCRSLANRAELDSVMVLDDMSTGSEANLAGVDVELHVGSVLDRPLLEGLVADVDSVVHLAARPSVPRSLLDPVASHEVNATGTLYVLEAARAAAKHVVVASSSSVYGDAPSTPKHEELPTRPLSPYGVSKAATEAYAIAYSASFGLPTLALRFFNVYGPLQPAGHAYAAVIPSFVDAALRGRPLTIYGDGHQTRDFTYVGSVVKVLLEATLRGVSSQQPVNLAFGSRHTLLEVVQLLERLLDMPLVIRHDPPRRGDIRDSQAAYERLAGLFPHCGPTPLEEGLTATIDWCRQQVESS